MIHQGYRLGVERRWYDNSLLFWLKRYDDQGKAEFVTNIEFAARAVENSQIEPSFKIPDECGQRLMDDLWAAGLRPTLGRQSEGVTGAQAQHIDDLRTIAFAALKINAPVKARP